MLTLLSGIMVLLKLRKVLNCLNWFVLGHSTGY